MAGRRVHFVMPAELVERIDAACGVEESRGEFVRRAVERALNNAAADGKVRERREELQQAAEQPERTVADVDAVLEPFRGMSGVPRVERLHAPSCKCPVCS